MISYERKMDRFEQVLGTVHKNIAQIQNNLICCALFTFRVESKQHGHLIGCTNGLRLASGRKKTDTHTHTHAQLMRLFARTLRRLWARPLKASCGHGMDAFTEGGATRTRPLISCQRLCACAPLLLLIVPAILATSSSTSSSTSSCSSYRSRLSAMQMSRCSICDHNNNNKNRSCLRLLL